MASSAFVRLLPAIVRVSFFSILVPLCITHFSVIQLAGTTPVNYTFPSSDEPQPLNPNTAPAGLTMSFYEHSCSHAESIIRTIVTEIFQRDHSIAAALLRLAFHDCFVQGCDASVLLNSVDGNLAERDAGPNKHSLRGFEIIEHIKSRLEEKCPSTVSCADIVVLSARDAVKLAGGPYYRLAKGRRDSLTSSKELAEKELPTPFDTLAVLIARFKDKGLNETDLVSLLGSHTLGQAHCHFFSPRLYNFSSTGMPDPRLNLEMFFHLSKACPRSQQQGSRNQSVPLDGGSNHVFDNSYFKHVRLGKGVLFVDQVLMDSNYTNDLVRIYADHAAEFYRDFERSMVKLSSLNVLTGQQGEIRKHCFARNDSHKSTAVLQIISDNSTPYASYDMPEFERPYGLP